MRRNELSDEYWELIEGPLPANGRQGALEFQIRAAQPPSVTAIGGKPGAQPTTGKSGP